MDLIIFFINLISLSYFIKNRVINNINNKVYSIVV